MHVERFLRISRAYLRASQAVARRGDFKEHGQLWPRTSARISQAVQGSASIASLWTTSRGGICGTSWPA